MKDNNKFVVLQTRQDNAVISQWMDRGIELHARVVRYRQSPDPWQRLQFDVLVAAANDLGCVHPQKMEAARCL